MAGVASMPWRLPRSRTRRDRGSHRSGHAAGSPHLSEEAKLDDGQTDPLRIGHEQRPTETDEQAEARMMRALSMMSAGSPQNGRPGAPGGVAPRPATAVPGGAPGQRAAAGRRAMPQATAAGQSRRHRFVQDGEVPVVNVARPRRDGMPGLPFPTRVGEVGRPQTDELALERAARIEAERRFAEIAVQLRSHQTRLGDAELARDAAETELRELRVLVQALQAENLALAQQTARRSTGAERAASASPDHRADPDLPDHRAGEPLDVPAADPSVEPVRRRTKTRADDIDREEPEPVKWWA